MVRAGLTAARLTEAAADLADEVGFDAVTVSAVARRFGVADASLYSHVRNREDLLTRVAVRAATDFADAIAAAVAGRSGREALVAFADAYRTFVLTHPGRYAATQFRVDPAVLAGSAGHQRLIDLTYAMMRGFALPEPDRTDAVRLLRSSFHGFAVLEAAGGFGHPRDVTASWRRAVTGLAHLLENWPARDTDDERDGEREEDR
ncbi:TetR/AcrR family transcriptional regulator [Plantactinospora sp. GCM10030261]|uniref:TetR/AcrR family transcriptional regulator n=1 Tax=Plantactinospora sp. GCM10030261 TaxID=3273420 RepID=UPI0036229895